MINLKIKENKNRILLILLILFLFSSWFYWFQWRPAEIRRFCVEQVKGSRNLKDDSYRGCLAKHGLKPEPLFIK